MDGSSTGVTTFIDGRKTQDTTELLNFTSKVDFTGSWTAGLSSKLTMPTTRPEKNILSADIKIYYSA